MFGISGLSWNQDLKAKKFCGNKQDVVGKFEPLYASPTKQKASKSFMGPAKFLAIFTWSVFSTPRPPSLRQMNPDSPPVTQPLIPRTPVSPVPTATAQSDRGRSQLQAQGLCSRNDCARPCRLPKVARQTALSAPASNSNRATSTWPL